MSTYTHIQTQIRDRQAMHRVLASIPGATVQPNAVIPAKAGGYLQTAFRVIVPNDAINAQSFFSSLFQGGVREFWVFENSDGTLFIEISHDIGAQHQVAHAVTDALARQQQQEQDWIARQDRMIQQEQQRKLEQQRQRQQQEQRQREAEQRRLAAEQKRKADAEARRQMEQAKRAEQAARRKAEAEQAEKERAERLREEAMIREQLAIRKQQAEREQTPQHQQEPSPETADTRVPTTPEPQQQPKAPSAEVQQEALDILARMKQQIGQPVANEPEAKPADGDQGLATDLNNAIAQEYSRQLVMEKIEEVKTNYGINLKEINQMEDGSIEIRLQG